MTDKPDNRIKPTFASQLGKVGEGLKVNTATMDICVKALSYITEGHLQLEPVNGRWQFKGDFGNPISMNAIRFYNENLGSPELSQLSPLERVAAIINRLALSEDEKKPQKALGVPSRMQAIWLIQNHPEQSVGR